jgi:hypothetical protein
MKEFLCDRLSATNVNSAVSSYLVKYRPVNDTRGSCSELV